MYRTHYSCHIMTKLESRKILIRFQEIPCNGSWLVTYGRTERETKTDMKKLRVVFRNFANALKMELSEIVYGVVIWPQLQRGQVRAGGPLCVTQTVRNFVTSWAILQLLGGIYNNQLPNYAVGHSMTVGAHTAAVSQSDQLLLCSAAFITTAA